MGGEQAIGLCLGGVRGGPDRPGGGHHPVAAFTTTYLRFARARGGRYTFYFHLLATYCVVDSLDVIGTSLAHHNLFRDVRGLADDCLGVAGARLRHAVDVRGSPSAIRPQIIRSSDCAGTALQRSRPHRRRKQRLRYRDFRSRSHAIAYRQDLASRQVRSASTLLLHSAAQGAACEPDRTSPAQIAPGLS